VYDKPAPVFKTDHAAEREEFIRQREEIRRVVFDPVYACRRTEHIVPMALPQIARPDKVNGNFNPPPP
jgi:hypothetical protein